MNDRYQRQERFYGIKREGQEKLSKARVAVVGLGALGSAIAEVLARAGVGYLRLIDRDFVELHNLQRQLLYTEKDASEHRLKAEACSDHLSEINADIVLDPRAEDVRPGNIRALLSDVYLILDGTDNMETRYLLNEFSVDQKIPWIYGGVIEGKGMTMNFVPDGPCMTCMSGQTWPEVTDQRTCSTAGVIAPAVMTVASLECAEAMKILVGAETVRTECISMDLWENKFHRFQPKKKGDCPICGKHQYHYLGHASAGTRIVTLCGEDALQVLPEKRGEIDFETMRKKLSPLGGVRVTKFCLFFENHEKTVEFELFHDGRAIIRGAGTEGRAREIYTDYIGN